VLRRLALSIPVLVVVPFLVFVLLDLSPGDAASEVAGPGASPAVIAQVRRQLHLNDPVVVRYWHWLSDVVFHGSFGTSFTTRLPVTTMIGRALPITLSLGLIAIFFTTVFGVAIGTFAAYHRDGVVDRIIAVLTSLAIATPGFWLGLMLVLIFAINLKWLPALGYVALADDPVEWFRHLLLPALALAALPGAAVCLQTRAALVDELEKDYVLAARSRGIPRKSVLFKHALKNAGVPVTTLLGFQLANLLAGAVIIEQVFDLHGIGQLAITAATGKDIPLLLGIVVMVTVSIVVVNLLVDLSYGYFSPRSRVGAH
jgi:peptide/nickel transport system permease protein